MTGSNQPSSQEELENIRRQVQELRQELVEEQARSNEHEEQLQTQLRAQAEELENIRRQAQEVTEEGDGDNYEDFPPSPEGFFASPVQEYGPYSQTRRTAGTEFVRALLSLIFAFAFAGAVLISYLQVGSWAEAKEWLQIVLPATTALLGAAIGFYFGTKGENT